MALRRARPLEKRKVRSRAPTKDTSWCAGTCMYLPMNVHCMHIAGHQKRAKSAEVIRRLVQCQGEGEVRKKAMVFLPAGLSPYLCCGSPCRRAFPLRLRERG